MTITPRRLLMRTLSAAIVVYAAIASPIAANAQIQYDMVFDEDGVAQTIAVPEGVTEYSQGVKGAVTDLDFGNDGSIDFLAYEPNPDENGEDSFTYTVQGQEPTTVTVFINPLPDAPVAKDDTVPGQNGDPIVENGQPVDVTAAILANDTDADRDELTIVAVGEASAGTVALVQGVVTYTPSDDAATKATFDYTIEDATQNQASATVTVDITPVDDAPVAKNDPIEGSIEIAEGGSSTIDVTANDTDVDGGPAVISIVDAPANGTAEVVQEGIAYTHNGGETTSDSFTYQLNAGTEAASQPATVSIAITAVDDAPVPVDDPANGGAIEVAEGGSIRINVWGNDTDVDGGSNTVNIVDQPAIGTATVVFPENPEDPLNAISPEGEVVYSHTGDQLGEVTFTYGLNGDTNTTATVTVLVVNADDDAPNVKAPATVELTEDDDPVTIPILADGETDVDGETLVIEGIETQGQLGTATVTGNSVSYDPAANANGQDSFVVRIADGEAQEDDQLVTVNVTIAAVNDVPVAEDDYFDTRSENYATEDQPKWLDVLDNDSDVDQTPLSIVAGSIELAPEIGQITIDQNQLYFVPAQDYFGEFTFSYVATDGELESDPASVTVRVISVDDPLVAVDDGGEVTEDGVVYIDVLDNDIDVDETGFEIIAVTQPANGFTAIAGDRIRVEPDPDFSGELVFAYQIQADYDFWWEWQIIDELFFFEEYFGIASQDCRFVSELDYDEFPGCQPVTAWVTVDVLAANDRPEAENDQADTDEDTALTIDVLANDTDADDEDLDIWSVSQATNGTVEIVQGQVLYTPNLDFHGTDFFIYYATDGEYLSIATVTVIVAPVNDDPTIADGEYEGAEDTEVSFDVEIADVDHDTGALLVGPGELQPEVGDVSIDGTNVTFTPPEHWFGQVTFEVDVTDGDGGWATGTFTVDITPVNDDPTVSDAGIELDEDSSGSVTLDAVDVDEDELTLEIGVAPAKGEVTFDGLVVTYTGGQDENGEDSFSVVVSDGNGGQAEATISVVITPVNDDPTIAGESLEGDEDNVVKFTPAIGDVDGDDLVMSVVEGSEPQFGKLAIEGGTATFTPPPDWHGTVSFELQVADGNEGLGIAEFEIVVNSVNDVPEIDGPKSTYVYEDGSVGIGIAVSDVEDDFAELDLTVEVTSQPAKGSVEEVEGAWVYTPNPDENGTDSYTLTVTDSDGAEADLVVAVTIYEVNDDPEATDCEPAEAETGTATMIDVSACGTDIDGDELVPTEQSLTSPDGEVSLQNGMIEFMPEDGFVGETTIEFALTDGKGGSVDSLIRVTVVDPVSPYAGAAEEAGEVVRLYSAMLGRLPDEAGFQYWTDRRENGLTMTNMVTHFADSEEFRTIYGDRLRNDTDEEWIAFVYRQVLGREFDEAGMEYWKSRLAAGLTRQQLVVWFANSEEHKLSTQTL